MIYSENGNTKNNSPPHTSTSAAEYLYSDQPQNKLDSQKYAAEKSSQVIVNVLP